MISWQIGEAGLPAQFIPQDAGVRHCRWRVARPARSLADVDQQLGYSAGCVDDLPDGEYLAVAGVQEEVAPPRRI
jgi:hypothetical protein